MKTSTKLVLAAASGYAFRAFLKRDTLKTNDALRHSVDRRLSVEGEHAVPLTFLERQAERIGRKIGTKLTQFLFDNPPVQSRHFVPEYPSSRRTRYTRFGRKGQN